MKPLRAYIGFSRIGGRSEGAVAIFAHTSQEAHRIAAPTIMDFFADGDWLDVAVHWMRDPAALRLADQVKLARGEPHVVESPQGCADCEYWHAEAYDENGRCKSCAENAKEDTAT